MTGDQHYFTGDPETPSRPIEIEADVRGLHLNLHSDRGVFSKAHVDRGTLLLAEKVVLPAEGSILDLGCGYGIIGIVCALTAPALRVTMVDVNARAADLAAKNCARLCLRNCEVLTGIPRRFSARGPSMWWCVTRRTGRGRRQ